MRETRYFARIRDLFGAVVATKKNRARCPLLDGIDRVASLIESRRRKGGKVFLIGNGGSASIASHIAVDFWKNGGVQAMAFNDSSLLTCVGNDYGYPFVFEKPLEMFARKGDVLIAISSSGKSENILRGAASASRRGIHVITCSGFRVDNPLRTAGEWNFYVPSDSYGHTEILHLSICHAIVDEIIARQKKGK